MSPGPQRSAVGAAGQGLKADLNTEPVGARLGRASDRLGQLDGGWAMPCPESSALSKARWCPRLPMGESEERPLPSRCGRRQTPDGFCQRRARSPVQQCPSGWVPWGVKRPFDRALN